MTKRQQKRLNTKASNIYYGMRRRLARLDPEADLPVEKEEIRNLISASLGLHCPYCCRRNPTKKLTIATLSVDHVIPVSLGKQFKMNPWELSNLQVCCRTCNAGKGPMTAQVFRELEDVVLQRWPNYATYIFASLAAGGGRYTRG